jgi:D-serine deaminase-like pyridoxal phosphate-dependent protein
MQERANAAGVRLRPHTKTHKSAYFARRQVALGAAGITVAKLGEAEVMAASGIDDILLAYPVVGPLKLARLRELLLRVPRFTCAVDSVEVAAGISEVGSALGRRVPVYLEVDTTDYRRLGQPAGEPSVALAGRIRALPGVALVGLMTHAGPAYAARDETALRDIALREAAPLAETARALGGGLQVSVGSTPTARFLDLAGRAGATEARPGTYIFNDRTQVQLGTCGPEDVAVTILATVVSRPAPDRVVIDAGSKTLTSDAFVGGTGFGEVRGQPAMRIVRLSEEHGVMQVPADCDLAVGDRVEILPNHVCPCVNLTDELVAIRHGRPEGRIAVDGRGRVR